MSASAVEAFCRALWKNDHATVTRLIQQVDPNGSDRWGNTPLLMAARYATVEVVATLLERGSSVDQGRSHWTPITIAASRKSYEIVRCLRGQRATESILTAIWLGEAPRVKKLLASDSGLAVLQDELGTPFIHHAAESLDTRILRLLLDHGAQVAATDPRQETALHRVADLRQAAPDTSRAMATMLLDRKADPNARNWDGVTPLHQAVRARNLAIVEELLQRGADPNARDKSRGSTPLRRAVSNTGAGGTAGRAAAMLALTELLLKSGADPNSCDKRGVSVRASARRPEICDLLNQYSRKRQGRSTTQK